MFGPAAEEILAVLMLVIISVAAGLIARTRFGRNVMRWTENSFLGGLPQYRLVKSVAGGFAQIENAENLKPVLVNIEEGWQIGYLLESLQTGWVVVFVPQAPTPMSGNVMYLTRAASVRLNGGGHVTRKAHGNRLFEGPGYRRSCAP